MTHPDPATRWKNRRRMAWGAFGGLVGLGLAGSVVELSQPQSELLIAVAYAFAAVIGAYVGFATMDDIKRP